MLYFSASTHPPHLIWDLVLRSPYLSCKDSQASAPSQVYLTGNWNVGSRGKKSQFSNLFSPLWICHNRITTILDSTESAHTNMFSISPFPVPPSISNQGDIHLDSTSLLRLFLNPRYKVSQPDFQYTLLLTKASGFNFQEKQSTAKMQRSELSTRSAPAGWFF